tara:strand:+ start:2089 stop:2526 length:438 start_codon:yes stop_codon:yes gene_type:complete
MKGPSLYRNTPTKQRKPQSGPTASRDKANEKENPSDINKVDPVTGGNNAAYEKGAGKLMQDLKDGKITKDEYNAKKKALTESLRKSPTPQKKVKEKESSSDMDAEAAREDAKMIEIAKKRGYTMKLVDGKVVKVPVDKKTGKPKE